MELESGLAGLTIEWWHWAVLGMILIMSELLFPMFVLVWFGLSALMVSVAVLIWPDMPLSIQILVWIVDSVVLIVLWFRIFRRNHHKTLIGRASADIVGEIGLVTEGVSPFRQGKVRFQKPIVGSDVWDCVADEEIAVGTRVRVIKVEGSLLKIEKSLPL